MKRLNIICAILAALAIVLGSAYVVRKQLNLDTTPPVFTVAQDTVECTIDADTATLCSGVTAVDDVDGDLTDHILVNEISIKSETEAVNDFDISYIVFDASNNMSTVTRTLVYSDYHAPHFALSDALRFNSISAVDLYDYLTAEDCIDGDISSQITIEMSDAYLNAISFGSYSCIVSVTNSVGDTAELPLTFDIVDTTTTEESTRPEIVLNSYLIYLNAGDEFDAVQYLKGVVVDNVGYWAVDRSELQLDSTVKDLYGYTNENYDHFILASSVDVSTDLDTATPGQYTVEYTYKHPEEGTRGTGTLIVIVE